MPESAVSTTCGINFFGRYVGRCKVCRIPIRVETTDTLGGFKTRACPTCDKLVKLQRVIGSKSERKCGAACLNAVGPNCDCSCEGHNHGAGY